MNIFDRFNELSKNKQIGIISIVYIILVTVFWMYIYAPKSEDVSKKKEEIQDLNLKILEKQKISKNLSTFESEVKNLAIKLENVLRQLPDRKEVDAFLKSISVLGTDTGLEVVRFSPAGEVPKDYFVELPVDIELQGSFHKLATFFYQLSKLPRIVNVDNINITVISESPTDVVIRARCRVTTYRYLEKSDKTEDKVEEPTSKRRR